jgi:sulfur relay (sulfurtransferase) DsrC/TusE family protein
MTQEKAEEDRYMKQQEDAWKEKLRALKAQEEASRDAARHAEVVDPVKKDIEELLAQTGDKVSDAGLEALAKFRLDL